MKGFFFLKNDCVKIYKERKKEKKVSLIWKTAMRCDVWMYSIRMKFPQNVCTYVYFYRSFVSRFCVYCLLPCPSVVWFISSCCKIEENFFFFKNLDFFFICQYLSIFFKIYYNFNCRKWKKKLEVDFTAWQYNIMKIFNCFSFRQFFFPFDFPFFEIINTKFWKIPPRYLKKEIF